MSGKGDEDVWVQLQELRNQLQQTEGQVKSLSNEIEDLKTRKPNRFILCFDGTSNQYMGDESDTNIVKIYKMLDRNTDNQYHYYQPGIGTYVANSQLTNTSSGSGLGSFLSGFKKVYDQMYGDSFADHVIAGYKFLMRYYTEGDKIYVFGFSRGAYTARFLSEMINDIGLLSRGNEEMVDFIWYQYSDFQRNRQSKDKKSLQDKISGMNLTFCRKNAKVHFLGLFDCVNSVREFSIPGVRKATAYIPKTSAKYIRHAVSLNERRAKFKPALFLLDTSLLKNRGEDDSGPDRLNEVWFAGNHGDVGGGWPLSTTEPPILLSDIPLRWMVQEAEAIDEYEDGKALDWNPVEVDKMKEDLAQHEQILKSESGKNLAGLFHDPLTLKGGSTWYMLTAWWFLELLPLKYYNLEKGGHWSTRHGWNLGCGRDIPDDARYHKSLIMLRDSKIIKGIPRRGRKDPFHFRNLWGLWRKKQSVFYAKDEDHEAMHPTTVNTSVVD